MSSFDFLKGVFSSFDTLSADLSSLDILALIVISISGVVAFVKGLTKELFSLASVVGGFFLSVFFYPNCSLLYLKLGLSSPLLSDFLSFLTIFLLAILLGSQVAMVADKVLRSLRLKLIDRALGGVFGLIRGWLTVAIIFLAFATFPVHQHLLQDSRYASFFLTTARLMVVLTPKEFKQKFDYGYQKLYQTWTQRTNPI